MLYIKPEHQAGRKQLSTLENYNAPQNRSAPLNTLEVTIRQSSGIEKKIQKTGNSSKQATLNAERDSLIARLGVLQDQLDSTQGVAVGQQGGGELVQRATVPGARR